jgi:hypothetical protein
VVPFANTNQIGIYQVTQRVHGQDHIGAFTVNLFNPLQSQLAPAKELPITHSTGFTATTNNIPRELREIWPWVAAFLLLVLCIEWWLFSGGYKQQKAAMATQREGANTNRFQRRGAVGTLATLQEQSVLRYRATMKRFAKTARRIVGTRSTGFRTNGQRKKRTRKGGKRVNI